MGRRERVLSGEVAYEVFGEDGPPMVLARDAEPLLHLA